MANLFVQPGYGHYVSLAVPMVDTTRAGFPNPGEVEELNRIESDIRETLEKNRECIFVGTTTIPGIREYILYARDPGAVQRKFDNDVLARVHHILSRDRDVRCGR